MQFSIDWLENGANAAPEERATLAEWRLYLAGQNVCLHLDEGQSLDHIVSPLYALAEGLAHDWWDIFGGRDAEVNIVRHRMGYATPDIRLRFDGSALDVTAHQKIYCNPDVRFWSGPAETLSRAQAEEQLATFIADVIAQLHTQGISGTAAQLRWNRVESSRQNQDEVIFCEAAGALGLDPYDIEDASAELIEQAARLFCGEPLVEFLGGLRARAQRARDAIAWVEAAERRPRYRCRLPELRDAARQASHKSLARAEPPWSLGYRRARALRDVLDWGPDHRVRTYAAAASRLGAPHFALADSVDGLTALRSDKDDGVYLHVRKQGQSAASSHIFAFARAVGDAVCFPEQNRAAVNELHEAYRQAAGRAFAAEFLAPAEEVLTLRSQGRDTASIASEFGVAPPLVERQIENLERIRSACA